MSPNPFLDDLQDEQTREAIESGNLKRKRAEPVFVAVWTHQGYVAHIQRQWCSCGARHDNLLGVFSRETSVTGESRDLALARGFQIPLDRAYPVEVSHFKTAVCPSCLSSKGFQEIPE